MCTQFVLGTCEFTGKLAYSRYLSLSVHTHDSALVEKQSVHSTLLPLCVRNGIDEPSHVMNALIVTSMSIRF